jgi:uncharacterized repeat protein (TIGR03803 family)
MDGAGNLSGTTEFGGIHDTGTVFKLSASGKESILYSFGPPSGSDGQNPVAGLIMDGAGNLYGTTEYGGTAGNAVCNSGFSGCGTVFKLSPSGTESVVHSFMSVSGTDGKYPQAGLIIDGSGNLYGTTPQGGINDNGIVFEISASGTESVLYSFGPQPGSDGKSPQAGLLMDSAGNLYGTTNLGGSAGGDGAVFKLATP